MNEQEQVANSIMALFQYIHGNAKTMLAFRVGYFPYNSGIIKHCRDLEGLRTPKIVWGFLSESMWGKKYKRAVFSTKFVFTPEAVTVPLHIQNQHSFKQVIWI